MKGSIGRRQLVLGSQPPIGNLKEFSAFRSLSRPLLHYKKQIMTIPMELIRGVSGQRGYFIQLQEYSMTIYEELRAIVIEDSFGIQKR